MTRRRNSRKSWIGETNVIDRLIRELKMLPKDYMHIKRVSKVLKSEALGPQKSARRISDFFCHFRDNNKLIYDQSRNTTKLALRNIFTTLTYLCATFLSLFFDKKGEFQHFRAFDDQSSGKDMLHDVRASILDTFSIKIMKPCPYYIIEPRSRRLSRKFFEEDFSVDRKIAARIGQTKCKIVIKDIQKSYSDKVKDTYLPWYCQSHFKSPRLENYRTRPRIKAYRFK